MGTISRFEEIEAWQIARQLTNLLYDWSDDGAFSRDFGLRDQIRRAAISVMSNIAEGFESQTNALFLSYLSRAKASAGEVRAQLYVALDRGYIDQEQFDQAYGLASRCAGKLHNLMRYLKSQPGTRIQEKPTDYHPAPSDP